MGKGTVLKKYLNHDIAVYARLAENRIVRVTGKLLSYSPTFLLQNSEGVQIYEDIQGVVLPQLPEGLLTLPALVWKVRNPLN